tara:strand:- start:336 stop:788 length:453 start_codon:yes stop_codon:yes gene_type:complete
MVRKLIDGDAWKAIGVAIIILLIGQGILTWQYYRLQEKQLPQIEEKLDAQQKEIELAKADKALGVFMNIRSSGSEEQVRRYLTERAVEQGIPSISSFGSYNIIQTDDLAGDSFRFQVEVQRADGFVVQLELVTVTKILNTYYIDSVVLAG